MYLAGDCDCGVPVDSGELCGLVCDWTGVARGYETWEAVADGEADEVSE